MPTSKSIVTASEAQKMSRRNFMRMVGVGGMGALAVAGYGDFGSRDLRLEKRELVLPKWEADGFRIGVISDVHVSNTDAVERAAAACAMLVREKPDAIVHVGDVMDTGDYRIYDNIENAFEPLHDAACPCFGVLGNHDHWTGEQRRISERLAKTPLQLMRNQSAEVDGVTIVGLDDALVDLAKPEELDRSKFSRSVITLLHEPDFVDLTPIESGLQLSGHSHGGQICLPFGIALHTPRGALRYISGFYPDARVPIYVSRGVGMIGPKWRMFCPPEAAILTLRSA